MPVISLKAHYDGKTIRLDEAYELPLDAQLIVTVLPPSGLEQVRAGWGILSACGLANTDGDYEPDYSDADLQS